MLKYDVRIPDAAAAAAARERWDSVAKPLGSLGKLETMIAQIAAIQGSADVTADPRCALVLCADHGVVCEGVTQTGREVTALVARSLAEGRSNVNLMADVARADVFAVDMGMASRVDHPGILRRRVAAGSADIARGPAMTRAQAEQAVQTGIDLVHGFAEEGYRMIAVGEMGIGNTTASAALCCAILGLTPEQAVGRGAGLSDEGLFRKREAVRRALEINRPDPSKPMEVLAGLGGYEIAGMAGVFLGGMSKRIPIIIDGLISATAALVAARLCPEARGYMLASHMSRERAAAVIMERLDLQPIIHADMALGEGTGAVALLPLIDMALAVYRGGHTFDSLGMAAYTPQGGQT